MADTPRTLAALQTLLADNITKDISPQDLRDALVSAMGGYGAIGVTGGVTAQASIGGTPVQVTGFAANGANASQCTPAHASDHITIDVGGTWIAIWTASFSGTLNVEFHGQITCTGTGTASFGAWDRKLGAGGDVGSATAVAVITGAVATDTVECMINGDGASDSFTPTEMALAIVRLA